VLAVAQEQHRQRSRLFAQWQRLDWPILHDPINVMQVRGVPIEVAIDEHGVVRSLRPKAETFEQEFLSKSFAADGVERVEGVPPSNRGHDARDTEALRRRAEQTRSSDAWRQLGDALVLWAGPAQIEQAINAYTQAIEIKQDDGDAHFRLGVCYRMRYESPQRKPADFQMAVDHWSRARQIEPNQYIWRRRIEQYGPRMTKPYPFYDWVQTAALEIAERGEEPIELKVLPTGSELAAPARNFDAEQRTIEPPDPLGRIARDVQNLIRAEVTVVPPRVKPGEIARVHVTLRPNEQRKAHWNNEAEPLRFWIDAPDGWKVQPQLLTAPQGRKPETSEPRRLEFEVRALRRTPYGAADTNGTSHLAAYALYYVCEDAGGTCQFLRQDVPIPVAIEK
jgi:tetratricopeptide (TPR) repeat protein